MAALPYMQWYPADYLADTAHLSTEEHGAYLLLLFNYWMRGKPLPNDSNKLARISGLSNERWTVVEHSIAEFFQIDDFGWHHERLDGDLEYVEAKQMKAVEAGKASGAARRKAARKASSTRASGKKRGDKPVEPTPPQKRPERTLSERSTNAERYYIYKKDNILVDKSTSSDEEIAYWMFAKIHDLNNKTKEPNFQAWAKTIRLMRERDKRTREEIIDVFTWANKDSFWQSNVLSPTKLRDKFDQLTMRIQGGSNGSDKRTTSTRRPDSDSFFGSEATDF